MPGMTPRLPQVTTATRTTSANRSSDVIDLLGYRACLFFGGDASWRTFLAYPLRAGTTVGVPPFGGGTPAQLTDRRDPTVLVERR